MAKGLLFASFDFTNTHADEFHDWYDLEHIPERLRVPGFLNAERWISEENPNVAVATYDLDTLGVLQSAPYKAIGYENSSVWTRRVTAMAHRIMRFTGDQIVPGDLAAPAGAGGLLVASMNVDPAAEPEFNEWYTRRAPGAVGRGAGRAVRPPLLLERSRIASASTWRCTVWRTWTCRAARPGSRAADTPWTARMRPHFRDMLVLRSKRYVRQ